MCLKAHFLLLFLTIIISSLSPFCLSSYPFIEHDFENYPTNYYSSSNNIISEEEKDDGINYYNDHELGLPSLANYERAISHHRVKHSSRASSRAHAPTSSPHRKVISVDDFLNSNQETDDTEAFRKAWKEACSSRGGVFLVPKNKVYRLKPLNFSGPCHSRFIIKILGSIEASDNISDYDRDRTHWLVFENIRNFKVQGGGTINGNGKIWWQNSCKVNKTKPCQHAPTAVTFLGCKNFIVDKLRIINAQQMHLTFRQCVGVRASNLVINAPPHSPNTDGIHVTETRHIQITTSLIRTGDDCISIVSGSKNVQATDITCGPGHGISIGSLGKGQSKAHVSTVLVNRARLSGTTNGVRIKTWQGGFGYAKNIVFENIMMRNVSNPIIVDQNYCDQKTPCQEQKSAVQISNVVYKNIRGTSATEVALKLHCSKNHRCQGIVLQNVNLVREEGKEEAKADCQHVKLFHRGKVSPKCSQQT